VGETAGGIGTGNVGVTVSVGGSSKTVTINAKIDATTAYNEGY